MSLRLQKEANLISYKGHSDVCSERSTGDSDDDGCCWFFELFPLACLFSHMAACRARGIPMQVPWFGATSSTSLIKARVPTFLLPLGPPLTQCVPHQQCLTHSKEGEQANLFAIWPPFHHLDSYFWFWLSSAKELICLLSLPKLYNECIVHFENLGHIPTVSSDFWCEMLLPYVTHETCDGL